MLKIFNHLKIKYRIKVRVGSEGVQPRTAIEHILESNHNLVRRSLRLNKARTELDRPLPEVEISNLENLKIIMSK